MQKSRLLSLMVLVLAMLMGCGNGFRVDYDYPVEKGISDFWTVRNVVVEVPDRLVVSEENLFAPPGDIVWRGEPLGDRKEQVARILKEALGKAAKRVKGNRQVVLKATLLRFHALSEKARRHLNFSGVHNISFVIEVIDVRTGVAMSHRDVITADLSAYVGLAARMADERGETQRKRIVSHIADVTSAWLNKTPDMRGKLSRVGL